MKRSERLHALEAKLRHRFPASVTAEELACHFEVSVRTIKRDLASLERSGVPLWSKPGPDGGYGLASRQSLTTITLSAEQAVALVAGVKAASDAPYSDLALSAVERILDGLDESTRDRAQDLSQRIWIDAGERSTRQVRSVLEQAIADQRVLRLGYRDTQGKETTREVEPMIFASRGGLWYLIGWCKLREEVRWFMVSRILNAFVTVQPCTPRDIAAIGRPPETAYSVKV